MQAPHRAVREGGCLPANAGVYISRWHHGSPAHRYGLYALQFVQEVNGVPVPDLAAFVRAVSSAVRAPSCMPLCSHPPCPAPCHAVGHPAHACCAVLCCAGDLRLVHACIAVRPVPWGSAAPKCTPSSIQTCQWALQPSGAGKTKRGTHDVHTCRATAASCA